MTIEESSTPTRKTFIRSIHKQQDSESIIGTRTTYNSHTMAFSTNIVLKQTHKDMLTKMSSINAFKYKFSSAQEYIEFVIQRDLQLQRLVLTSSTSHEQEIYTSGDQRKIQSSYIEEEDSCTKETGQDR